MVSLSTILFTIGVAAAASGFLSPAVALLAGLAYGWFLPHPFHAESKKATRVLLQASVVALGLGMKLPEILRVGRSGALYSALGITLTMLFGLALGQRLRVKRTASFLISAGTAICGGSAIAALAPICHASDEEMAVSLGVIFLLNAAALLIFPTIGHALKMTGEQFGLWAALAIHDTSSVVGAGAKYGPTALAVATAVKLARALWIIPLSLATAAIRKSQAKIQWPWFILFFCGAALANSLLPQYAAEFGWGARLGRLGLTVTLFLIGTGLSKESVRQTGKRPMLQGVMLWAIVATGTLLLILQGWIRLI